uniref:Major facilitator superfamily (MFS) profile domain-containing protein n=1 Tax=Clastoptera arizonana TaxID=38151 RepID=A0A1B6DMD7_9HEMI
MVKSEEITVNRNRGSQLPEESRRFHEEDVPELPPPPDGGYGWVIVVVSFLCNMVVDGITYTFGVFLPEFVQYYGEGKGTVAWVGSILTGMCFVAGPIVGGLSNKYGCRVVSMAGSLIGCAAFVLSTFSPNVLVLMLTYGLMGGIGFGLIYLPAVVCVGYYFETKRSLATGIAVCGSGFGAFAFAPLAQFLLSNFKWQEANLILSGIIFSCIFCGALMRPLTFPSEPKHKPLLQRMAEDKKKQMETGSVQGSYFMVQLADGTLQKMMKVPPINVDPGVHSGLYLDQLTPNVSAQMSLPTIVEGKTPHSSTSLSEDEKPGRSSHANGRNDLPHVSTQPELLKKNKNNMDNGSAPLLNKSGAKESNEEEDAVFTTSRSSIKMGKDRLRPVIKRDIFYSGSIQNLKEYQSQGSLAYRQSNLSLRDRKNKSSDNISCLPDPLVSVLSSMVDLSLVKDPVFVLIALSNLTAFVALYVPFVYLVDHATKVDLKAQEATLLISVIGIVNTLGRIVCGWVADFPSVNSLLLNNSSLVLASLSVLSIPFCHSYTSYLIMAVCFGIAISIFISLTSIILVDLLGLSKLTNAFGLLMLFRGVASLVGSPIAGMVYDATGTYTYPFYMAGIFFLVSAVLSFAVPFYKRSHTNIIPAKMTSLECIEEGNEE